MIEGRYEDGRLGSQYADNTFISTVKVKARVRARLRSLSHGFSMFTGHEM